MTPFYSNRLVCFPIVCIRSSIQTVLSRQTHLVIELVLHNIESYYWFVVYLYSLIIVCAFAPVENPNKRLTSNDKKRCKIISIILMVVWLTVMFLFYSFDSELYHIVALTLFFVANLMLLGKYSGRRETK